jgi:hypothetical protein
MFKWRVSDFWLDSLPDLMFQRSDASVSGQNRQDLPKLRLCKAEKCILLFFFLKWVSGLADFEDISGFAISGHENCEN